MIPPMFGQSRGGTPSAAQTQTPAATKDAADPRWSFSRNAFGGKFGFADENGEPLEEGDQPPEHAPGETGSGFPPLWGVSAKPVPDDADCVDSGPWDDTETQAANWEPDGFERMWRTKAPSPAPLQRASEPEKAVNKRVAAKHPSYAPEPPRKLPAPPAASRHDEIDEDADIAEYDDD